MSKLAHSNQAVTDVTEATHTPGPWEYVASTEHHGPYVAGPYGGDVCDCYTMSNLTAASVRNGGNSFPINFQAEMADANARLIAAAPDLKQASIEQAILIEGAQAILTDYLIPDGISAAEAVSRLLWHFDGPEQRRVTALHTAAIAKAAA